MALSKPIHGTITVCARRWFDKINGNTYHSVHCVMPDGETAVQGMTYGYGTMYEQTAFDIVQAWRKSQNLPYTLDFEGWRWYEQHGYKVVYDVAEVARKRDLHQQPN